ncbi:hypothetical protein [Bradyrhizobium sp. 141]|uniref:hypothetical protein n=1 Tax=Bradyrhizobium sp. 141 TaxID=2782617 RepID=UPI001FF9F839|nr:hypothetical protein [Bradyrhizobium sp. 141]MCK1716547.1 hypothetical protein [Bradyrhizobium sp. 141]
MDAQPVMENPAQGLQIRGITPRLAPPIQQDFGTTKDFPFLEGGGGSLSRYQFNLLTSDMSGTVWAPSRTEHIVRRVVAWRIRD